MSMSDNLKLIDGMFSAIEQFGISEIQTDLPNFSIILTMKEPGILDICFKNFKNKKLSNIFYHLILNNLSGNIPLKNEIPTFIVKLMDEARKTDINCHSAMIPSINLEKSRIFQEIVKGIITFLQISDAISYPSEKSVIKTSNYIITINRNKDLYSIKFESQNFLAGYLFNNLIKYYDDNKISTNPDKVYTILSKILADAKSNMISNSTMRCVDGLFGLYDISFIASYVAGIDSFANLGHNENLVELLIAEKQTAQQLDAAAKNDVYYSHNPNPYFPKQVGPYPAPYIPKQVGPYPAPYFPEQVGPYPAPYIPAKDTRLDVAESVTFHVADPEKCIYTTNSVTCNSGGIECLIVGVLWDQKNGEYDVDSLVQQVMDKMVNFKYRETISSHTYFYKSWMNANRIIEFINCYNQMN